MIVTMQGLIICINWFYVDFLYCNREGNAIIPDTNSSSPLHMRNFDSIGMCSMLIHKVRRQTYIVTILRHQYKNEKTDYMNVFDQLKMAFRYV